MTWGNQIAGYFCSESKVLPPAAWGPVGGSKSGVECCCWLKPEGGDFAGPKKWATEGRTVLGELLPRPEGAICWIPGSCWDIMINTWYG